jgi:Family of unknown function (DUF6011)
MIHTISNERKVIQKAVIAHSSDMWADQNRTILEFLKARADQSNFCSSLLSWFNKNGSLTQPQQAAVHRMMIQQEELAADAARAAKTAPSVSVDTIMQAFDRARAVGIKSPKMRVGEFVFKAAKANSINAGGIYVTEARGEGTYLGKVMGSKFLKVRECGTDQEARIVAVCADPKAAAIAHGKKFGMCSICGRELSDPASIEAGIGPICADNYGW